MQNLIAPTLFEAFTRHAYRLVAELESGGDIDLTALAQGMGLTLEYMLCELFSADEATSEYWVDGVVLRPTLLSDGSIIATGYAWCTQGRLQWQVPAQIHFDLSHGPDSGIKLLKICVGDAKHATLKGHHSRRPTDAPREWLLEFNVSPA